MAYNILLVDDDEDFRAEFIDCFNGFHFIEAANGEEALRVLNRPHEIDLIILDVVLPDRRGTQLIQSIRALVPKMPIIILTGYSTKDTAVEALKSHADDYLEKPFQLQKTKEIIDRILHQTGPFPDIDLESVRGKIDKIKHFIERNYDKIVSLKDVADLVSLSPKYLSRVFHKINGQGFKKFQLEIKIQKAISLLKSGQTVNHVSEALGYQNTESFIRVFKQYTGKTPKRYRPPAEEPLAHSHS